jgi:hypothetical protein
MGTCSIFVMCEPLRGGIMLMRVKEGQLLILRMRLSGFCQKAPIRMHPKLGL